MKKIKLFIACVAAMLDGQAMAQTLTPSDVTIEANGTADLVVSLESPEKAALAEFFLVLPEGITIAKDEDGDYEYTIGDLLTNKHTVSVLDRADGSIYVNAYSLSGKLFQSESGTFITLPLVAGDIADGDITAQMTNIIIASVDAQQMNTVTEATVNITVGAATGIKGITAEQLKAGEVYDLQGRKVTAVNSKGIYVVNGKKVVVK